MHKTKAHVHLNRPVAATIVRLDRRRAAGAAGHYQTKHAGGGAGVG